MDALVQLVLAGKWNAAEVIAAVSALLKDKDDCVRTAAVEALAQLAEKDDAKAKAIPSVSARQLAVWPDSWPDSWPEKQ